MILGTPCIFSQLILTKGDYFYPQCTHGVLVRLLLSGDGEKGLFRFPQILSGSVAVYSDWAGKQEFQEFSWGKGGWALVRVSPSDRLVPG